MKPREKERWDPPFPHISSVVQKVQSCIELVQYVSKASYHYSWFSPKQGIAESHCNDAYSVEKSITKIYAIF